MPYVTKEVLQLKGCGKKTKIILKLSNKRSTIGMIEQRIIILKKYYILEEIYAVSCCCDV